MALGSLLVLPLVIMVSFFFFGMDPIIVLGVRVRVALGLRWDLGYQCDDVGMDVIFCRRACIVLCCNGIGIAFGIPE